MMAIELSQEFRRYSQASCPKVSEIWLDWHMFAAHAQHFSAGYQQLQLAAVSEQFPHLRVRSRDLLKVIEISNSHLSSN